MKILTKEDVIAGLRDVRNMGWIPNARPGNQGGIGNTVEDLLGIPENNLPIPNAGEWELKCQRLGSASLITLFHMEPSPRALKFVPSILLPYYGWRHQKAGTKYPPGEMSFRQTINAFSRTDRGFGIAIDRDLGRVVVSFDASAVDSRHEQWLSSVDQRIGLGELNPQPYWELNDLLQKVAKKLTNCFFVQAEFKKEADTEYFKYISIMKLEQLSVNKFAAAFENGTLLIDFDARTKHNHGTKFRLRQDRLPDLYERVEEF